ncbi:MAG: hypothetical protein SLAVMIC_00233 [uncultured marine phage]|uniref:Uncharacterized protein n=1 Tax=uncultured marine phage TaxID=707152 RepID=A0A8D9C8K5_9VIRU|nr:MAG: hypothetical protein SLAVMIC_00233 [uncultured marine phage]
MIKYVIVINDDVQFQNIGKVLKVKSIVGEDYHTVLEGFCDAIKKDCTKDITEDWYNMLKNRNLDPSDY